MGHFFDPGFDLTIPSSQLRVRLSGSIQELQTGALVSVSAQIGFAGCESLNFDVDSFRLTLDVLDSH